MIIFLIALLGGAIYRWRGEKHPLKKYFPRPILQVMFAAPYAYLSYITFGIWGCVATLIGCTLACMTGHGHNMDVGHSDDRDVDYERYEFLIKWLHGKIPEYWYDALGMAVGGIWMTLFTFNPILIASGALKAPAYMIGWWMHDRGIRNKYIYATSVGEFLTGFFLWGALAWLLI